MVAKSLFQCNNGDKRNWPRIFWLSDNDFESLKSFQENHNQRKRVHWNQDSIFETQTTCSKVIVLTGTCLEILCKKKLKIKKMPKLNYKLTLIISILLFAFGYGFGFIVFPEMLRDMIKSVWIISVFFLIKFHFHFHFQFIQSI